MAEHRPALCHVGHLAQILGLVTELVECPGLNEDQFGCPSRCPREIMTPSAVSLDPPCASLVSAQEAINDMSSCDLGMQRLVCQSLCGGQWDSRYKLDLAEHPAPPWAHTHTHAKKAGVRQVGFTSHHDTWAVTQRSIKVMGVPPWDMKGIFLGAHLVRCPAG